MHKRNNKQKLSTNLTLYKLTQTTEPTLGWQKPKGRRNSTFFKERIQFSWEKETSNTISKKIIIIIKKRQRNTTQMKYKLETKKFK